MNNNAVRDERIKKETGKYGMQAALLMAFGIIIETVVMCFIARATTFVWLFDLLLLFFGAGYLLIRILKNGTVQDERVKEDTTRYTMQMLAIFTIGLFAEVIVKSFFLHAASIEWAGSLTILVIGLSYFSIQLFAHGLNAPASVMGVELPTTDGQRKRKTWKDYLITDTIIAAGWLVLDLMYPQMLFWIPLSNHVVSVTATIVIELVGTFLVGFLLDIVTFHIVSKIADRQIDDNVKNPK